MRAGDVHLRARHRDAHLGEVRREVAQRLELLERGGVGPALGRAGGVREAVDVRDGGQRLAHEVDADREAELAAGQVERRAVDLGVKGVQRAEHVHEGRADDAREGAVRRVGRKRVELAVGPGVVERNRVPEAGVRVVQLVAVDVRRHFPVESGVMSPRRPPTTR